MADSLTVYINRHWSYGMEEQVPLIESSEILLLIPVIFYNQLCQKRRD